MDNKGTKKTRYAVFITLLVMIMIPVVFLLVLRSSKVQTYLTGKAAAYISEQLQTHVSVGGVDINWLLHIVISDITIEDARKNVLLHAEELTLNVNKVNFTRRHITLDMIKVRDANVNLQKYPDENMYNYQFLVDYFSDLPPPDPSKPKWNFVLRALALSSSSLSLKDQNQTIETPGFNPSAFAFTDLDIDIRDISLSGDTLMAHLHGLSVIDNNGFEIKNAKTNFFFSNQSIWIHNFALQTQHSRIFMDLTTEYEGLEAFQNPFHDLNFLVDMKPSTLRLKDVGYFINDVYGLDNAIDLQGTFSGTLAQAKGSNINIRYGLSSVFQGDFFLSGLPDTENTFVNFNVENFVSNKNDFETFYFPGSANPFDENLQLPEELINLGAVSFSGRLTGFLHDFVAYGNFTSALGNMSTDIAIVSNDRFKNINYKGNLSLEEFDLGRFTDETDLLGSIGMNANLVGSSRNFSEFDLNISGDVDYLDFKNYRYRNLDVAGHYFSNKFNGNIMLNDPNITLDFSGLADFSQHMPYVNFTAQIDNANLSALNIMPADSLHQNMLSTIISIEGSGDKLNTLEGEFTAYKTWFRRIARNNTQNPETNNDTIINEFRTDAISLNGFTINEDEKLLKFHSDFLDLVLEGKINYETLAKSFERSLAQYTPSGFPADSIADHRLDLSQNFTFSIQAKQQLPALASLFLPGLQLDTTATINGSFDASLDQIKLNGYAGFVSMNNAKLEDLFLQIESDSTQFDAVAKSNRLFLGDTLNLDEFSTRALLYHDTLKLATIWGDDQQTLQNGGKVEGVGTIRSPNSAQFSFLPSYAYVNDSLWSISPDNQISIDSSRVNIANLFLYKMNEFLIVDGTISKNPDDMLEVFLNNFNIENFMILLKEKKVDFSGIGNGRLSVSSLLKTPNISADLLIKDFAFNNDHLGDLNLTSYWDAERNGFRIDTDLIYYGNVGFNKPLTASGYFYPDREKDNFDLDIYIENLKMSVFSRYVSSFASRFRGLATGNLRLEGPLQSPELSGKARLLRTGFRVDYLNTSYSFAHEIEIGKGHFSFQNLILNDTIGNTANVSGIIRHNNFKNFDVDISFLLNSIIALNTQQRHNELFYGEAFASGLLRVHGPANDIAINITAKAERGTRFFLPLDYTGSEVTQSSFIKFVEPNEEIDNNSLSGTIPAYSDLNLNFDLEVTPESEIQIIFDSQIGDIIRGRGFGNLNIEFNNQGEFNMYGDYTIQEGDYLFTLQNLINKRFRVAQGGNIRWSGDPYDAEIDITALYRTRTSLHDLAIHQTDTTNNFSRRVPVETVLILQDKLFNPSISFDINMPGADESMNEMIDRLITTEQEMNRQVFSLLILNRFVPPEDGFNNALGYGMGSTSTELLSNQLSNWLSQISNDFDIGVNYRPGDQISSQELEVALSTQLFDDRVIIDGNLGVAGNHPAQNQHTSNIIGDVNVEVKITPEGKFRVKAFNRSNTFDILNNTAPYTQGVGIFYRKEFDSLGELFRRTARPVLEIPQFENTEEDLPDAEARE
ncbi:MAG: translocation/assembly module TamB domain-containing protein [Bacteroidales bacterium]